MTSDLLWNGPQLRSQTRDELNHSAFDLLVIGGGILGTSVTWMAAQAGLRVAMVEAGDFAGATSSASSKLVHGGLRYLQTGNVRLVAENHKERRALAVDIAPHLVNPLKFLVPVYKDGPHGALTMEAGVFLYSALSGFRDGIGKVISKRHARRLVPELRTENLRACAVYGDHQMNDSRVAITTVRAAVNAGAVVLNHAEVVDLRRMGGRVCGATLRDVVDGAEFEVHAGLVLNATGPWVDHLRGMEDKNAEPSIRLSKGVHVVMKRQQPWRAALTIPIDKYRVSFAIPWEDHLLLGTTDEPYEADPAKVRPTEADIEQILGEAAHGIVDEQLNRDDIVYSYAGLRVLPGGPGDTSKAKRETVVTEGHGGMLSVAGGKWTTYRHIGRMVMDRLLKLPGHPLGEDVESIIRRTPLPGFGNPAAIAHRLLVDSDLRAELGGALDAHLTAHLAKHYGTFAFEIAALVRRNPELGARIHPDGPDIWAQAIFGRDNEWACTPDDILRRRTTVTVRGLDSEEVRAQAEKLFT